MGKNNSRVAEVYAGRDRRITRERGVRWTKMTVIGGLIAIFDLKNAAAVKRGPRTRVHKRVHARTHAVVSCISRGTERGKTAWKLEPWRNAFSRWNRL